MTARPLRRLTTEAAAIAGGDLNSQVEPAGRGEVYSLSLSLRDMANRLTSQVKEVEVSRALTNEQNDLMRELLRRTVRLQEDERRRIAGDIHDAVSPLITGALYRVRALLLTENGNGHGQPTAMAMASGESEQTEGLVVTTELLEQSMDELHNVIFALRPPDLDDLGLEAAVERYVNQINRTGFPPSWRSAARFAGFRRKCGSVSTGSSRKRCTTRCAMRMPMKRWSRSSIARMSCARRCGTTAPASISNRLDARCPSAC